MKKKKLPMISIRLLVLICCSAPIAIFAQNVINVRTFGAKGDGVSNDTRAINAAVLEAGKRNLKLYFEKDKTYVIDTISLTGTKTQPFKKIEIVGNNATIKCKDNGANNVLNFFFIDTLIINKLKISGNKIYKSNGHGIGVYYSKYCEITNCSIKECKYSGILIAWVRRANINNNLIFNNGDGSLPTDGISVHSLQGGIISCNIIYNNNPRDTQDGDGIQIGNIKNGVTGYYDINNIQTIEVKKNICYLHGRRGIKIQRPSVVVEKNFLSDNAIGVSVVNGLIPINNVQIRSNVIRKSYKGITTDGGGKVNISGLSITDNYLLGSIMTERIWIQDAKGVSISKNFFDKHKINVYDKKNNKVNYLNINSQKNSSDIDSVQNNIIDMDNIHAVNATKKLLNSNISTVTDNSPMINIEMKNNRFNIPADALKKDEVFFVFNNTQVLNAKVSIDHNDGISNYKLAKNKILIIYSCGGKLLNYRYQ